MARVIHHGLFFSTLILALIQLGGG